MKNLMDFCIGTVVFILIGFGLLLGEDLFGFIGKPGFDIFTAYGEFDYSSFVFNLVFCAITATIVEQLGSIFLTTTVAPAIATVVCMLFTWIKYGKPDVSMCLNASLAGLVGITAGCDVTDCFGASIIGVVSGLLVVFGVGFLDNIIHVDDPVGAVAVHFFNGIWGTIAVGLDSCEHGLPSAYAGFSIMDIANTMTMDVNENTDLGEADYDKASDLKKNMALQDVE